MGLGTILLIILIILLIGTLPTWGYSRSWGYMPTGGLGLVLVIVLILVLHGLRGRWAPALGMAWGFAWIAYERLRGQPHTWSIGISAGAAGLLILLAALAIRTNLRQPPKDENTPLR